MTSGGVVEWLAVAVSAEACTRSPQATKSARTFSAECAAPREVDAANDGLESPGCMATALRVSVALRTAAPHKVGAAKGTLESPGCIATALRVSAVLRTTSPPGPGPASTFRAEETVLKVVAHVAAEPLRIRGRPQMVDGRAGLVGGAAPPRGCVRQLAPRLQPHARRVRQLVESVE